MFTHWKWHFDDLSLCLLTTHNQNDPLKSALSFVFVCALEKETKRSDNIADLLRSPHDHTQVKPFLLLFFFFFHRSNFGLCVYSCSDFFGAEEILFGINKRNEINTQKIHKWKSVLVDNRPILPILSWFSIELMACRVSTHTQTHILWQSHDEEQK